MDFIEGLSRSEGYTMIMVVVDRPSKYSHFIGLKHPFMAKEIASTFIRKIVRLHGFPRPIGLTGTRFSLAISGQSYFDYKVPNSIVALPFTRKRPDKWNASANVWKHTSVVSMERNCDNGITTFLGENCGITLLSNHPLMLHRFMQCMVVLHHQ